MEGIKLLVQEEGRSARNLVAFNVPVIQTQCDTSVNKIMRKPPTSPRPLTDNKKDDILKWSIRSRESSQSGSRVRSASTGRDKRSELHARYWAFLFGNLQRAVDEIYQTCESDESIAECKEVIMVLDNYMREFRNLINWFKIKWDYETTPPPQRPRSLAWEIRKSSPGKIKYKLLEPVSNGTLNNSVPLSIYSDSFTDGNSRHQIPKSRDDNLITGSNSKKSSVISQPIIENNVENETANDNDSNGSLHDLILGSDVNRKCNVSVPNVAECVTDSLNYEKVEVDKCTEDHTTCGSQTFLKVDMLKESGAGTATMTDEMCQTDPEKDVDENGPRFISSSQQTCPSLTGFYVSDLNVKNNTDCNEVKDIKKQPVNGLTSTSGLTTKPMVKAKSLHESALHKEDGKTLTKAFSSAAMTKISSTTSTIARTLAKSSYSHITTYQSKSANGQVVTKSSSGVKLPTNKMSNSVTQRQPWNCRPLPNKSTVSGNSSQMGRLIRSKTVVEVRGPGRNAASVSKHSKATPSSKQNDKVIQSADSLKLVSCKITNEPSANKSERSSSYFSHQDTSGSVEVLTSQASGHDEDDGWVKVRSRSRYSPATKTGDLESTLSLSASNLKTKGGIKNNPKTRYNLPSSAISLPTLAFSASDCKENIISKKLTKPKIDGKYKPKENTKTVKKPEKIKMDDGSNKKKINGDKTKKKCNENNLNETVKSDGHARIEMLENQKKICVAVNGLKSVTTSIPMDHDSIDEDENSFDEEIKKNKETEEMLQKEISELEATDIELETGDEETDGEATTGTEEEAEQEKKVVSTIHLDNGKRSPKKLHRFDRILNGMSWADHMDTLDELERLVVQDCSNKGMTTDEQMDTLERLEEFVARHPGRALELHQKLSSPSRRRTMLDTVKKFQARQEKASEKREQLKMAKAQKLRELLKKVDEVKAAKDKLIEDRRQRLEMKLKRAAENRNLHLKEIMRKAHDEEEKLKEIAFINELEAQNKRHDFMTQCQEQEGRLQGIHEERQRKQEEKAAKEAAVEERRKAIEAERQEKLEKMQERLRKRDEQADKKKQEKEKERQELAREKARDRSERLEALHAAQLEAQEELQKKIQQKQEDYARRHEENIEQIRQKALELSILRCSDDVAPRLIPYETQKLCTACNVMIGSEVYLLSHLRGKKHQEAVKNSVNGKDLTKEEVERYNIKIIINAPADKIDPKIALDKERIKTFKKKCKKIRLRMVSKGNEYLLKLSDLEKPDSPGKTKLQKCLKSMEKVISTQGKGQWNDSAITILERSMGEITRTLNKQDAQDKLVFKSLNGFSVLNNILQLDLDVPKNMTPYLPQKCFVTASTTYLAAISNSPSNCKFVILSNKILSLLDVLLKRLTGLIPDHISGSVIYSSKPSLPVDPVANVVMRVIAEIIMGWEVTGSPNASNLSAGCPEDFLQRLQDIISYTVSVGIVDKLTRYCKSVRDPIDGDLLAARFLLSTLELLTTLTIRCKTVRQGAEDPTQLLATLQVTELVGAVSILYGMLLHQGAPPRLIDATPPPLPTYTIDVALGTIRLLRAVAELDLQMFQSILGAEGISLQFRHIASYLLWYCCNDREKNLLHEVVSIVGYFAVQHRDNQMILQSGSTPTVLQQLCNLPFPYFSNPELSALLFPTLLACCSDNGENTAILEQEISYSLLEDFMESDAAADHPLILLINPKRKSGAD